MTDRIHSMRWRSEEWTNVEHLAKHYGLSVPDLFRLMVAKEIATVGAPEKRRPTKTTPYELNILRVLAEADEPLAPWGVLQALFAEPFNVRAGDGKPGRGVSPALERLRVAGLVSKTKAQFQITDSGRKEVEE